MISSVQKLEKDFYPLVALWKIISPRGSFSGYSGAFFFFLSAAVSNVKNELSAPVALFERAQVSVCTAFPRIHLS